MKSVILHDVQDLQQALLLVRERGVHFEGIYRTEETILLYFMDGHFNGAFYIPDTKSLVIFKEQREWADISDLTKVF